MGLFVAMFINEARWNLTKWFTYGYDRVEDLAGVFVVLVILILAVVVGYVSIDLLFHPQDVTFLKVVAAAALIGFFGNDAVTQLRRVGTEIGSAALVADGYHVRTDGWTNLAILIGALGVYFGFPLADPVIGLIITIIIFWIIWDSGKTIFTRLLDGVDPSGTNKIRHTNDYAEGMTEFTDVNVRGMGHRLHAEGNIPVGSSHSVEKYHRIAKEFRMNFFTFCDIFPMLPFMSIW